MGGGGDVFPLRSTSSSVPLVGRFEFREESIVSRAIQYVFGGTKDYKRLGGSKGLLYKTIEPMAN